MHNSYKRIMIKLNLKRWSECLVHPCIHSSLVHQFKSQDAFTLLQQASTENFELTIIVQLPQADMNHWHCINVGLFKL